MASSIANRKYVQTLLFGIVGAVIFFILGEQFGRSGLFSALIFLLILIGFIFISSLGRQESAEDEDSD